MGRPKLPRNEARKILIGAKFSPPEARSVEQSARESKLDKSKWIRERLLEHAKSRPSSNPGGSIQYLEEVTTLDKHRHVVANGTAILYLASGTGEFFPEKRDPSIENKPPQSLTTLRTSTAISTKFDRGGRDLPGRGTSAPHLHFEFAPLHATSEA